MNAKARVSPQAVESEQALLGGLIADPGRLDDITQAVDAADFYRPDHGRLFMLLRNMRRGGDVIDLVTVGDRVMAGQGAEQYGGFAYVLGLPDKIPSTANLGYYARIVREKAELRKLIKIADEIADAAYESERPGEVVDRAMSALTARASDGLDEWQTYADAADDALTAYKRVRAGDRSAMGIPVALDALAAVLGDLPRGEVTVIAARPSMGKSALARKLAEYAGSAGHGVGIYSLEMSAIQLAAGTLGAYSDVSPTDMRKDATDAREDQIRAWQRFVDARDSVAELPLFVCRQSSLTVEDIVSRTHALHRRLAKTGTPLGMIVVDYLQLITPGRGDNRAALIGDITRQLKVLASGLGIAVVLLSQLNRDCEKREDKRPETFDLRESGSIEQDAGVIMFIYREWVYDKSASARDAEIIVRKNRGGAMFGVARVRFDGPTTNFYDAVSDAMVIR